MHHQAECAWHLPGHPGWTIDEQPHPNHPEKYASTISVPQPQKAPQPRPGQGGYPSLNAGQAPLPRPQGLGPTFFDGIPNAFSFNNPGWLPRSAPLMGMQIQSSMGMSAQPYILRHLLQSSAHQPGQMQGAGYPPGALRCIISAGCL
jgi:hypothetical protein